MQVAIVPMTREEEARGKAYVHCTAWKETYRGILSQSFLDGRTLAFSEERALRAFRSGVSTLLAKDADKVVGFVDYGAYRGDDLPFAGEVYAIYLPADYYGCGIGTVLGGNARAIRFYESLGFRLDGMAQTLNLGGEAMDLRMVLRR